MKHLHRLLAVLLCCALLCAALPVQAADSPREAALAFLQQQAKVVEQELEALRDENASLIATKEKLEDPEYIQTYARGEYMFSKGDEKVFYLP